MTRCSLRRVAENGIAAGRVEDVDHLSLGPETPGGCVPRVGGGHVNAQRDTEHADVLEAHPPIGLPPRVVRRRGGQLDRISIWQRATANSNRTDKPPSPRWW